MIEPAFLLAAFVGGLVAMACRLPTLVGFLAGGFALRVLGYETTPLLDLIADIGVTLLLFSIGLKLDIRTLLRRDIWGGVPHCTWWCLPRCWCFCSPRSNGWGCRCSPRPAGRH